MSYKRPNMITHLLAVDGGGTKTALRLTPKEAHTTGPFVTLTFGPSSLTQQKELGIQTLVKAIQECLDTHDLKPNQVAIAIGVAGAGNPEMRQKLEQALIEFPQATVTTDAHISLLGANHGEPVNAIAIGTGSVATRLESNGEATLYGGWGFPIADEGGGAWLGQQAVRALIDSMDTGIWTPIGQKLSEVIGKERSQVLRWLKLANATDFAEFAPIVIQFASHECSASQAIMLEASEHIDKLISKCCKGNNLPIAMLGSLGQYYQQHLASNWQQRVIQAKGDALDGATILALQQVEKIYE